MLDKLHFEFKHWYNDCISNYTDTQLNLIPNLILVLGIVLKITGLGEDKPSGRGARYSSLTAGCLKHEVI